MTRYVEYRFSIDAFTPDTLPMGRLAQYMADLARLLGEREYVHFVRLEGGSAVLVEKIDWEAAPKVEQRVRLSDDPLAPPDVQSACRALNERLADDNAVAELSVSNGGRVVRFPGRERVEALEYGPFSQEGTLDGVLIRLGGKDEIVPVHLQEGERTYTCHASRTIARELAPYLFGTPVRVHGTGRWFRSRQGEWTLRRFTIDSFEALDDAPLTDVVRQLRDTPGSEWTTIPNAQEELARLRQD